MKHFIDLCAVPDSVGLFGRHQFREVSRAAGHSTKSDMTLLPVLALGHLDQKLYAIEDYQDV